MGRSGARAFTLIELRIAIAVLAMISRSCNRAFDGLERTKEGVTRLADCHHQGRVTLQCIAYELGGAYIGARAAEPANLVAIRNGVCFARATCGGSRRLQQLQQPPLRQTQQGV